MNPKYHLEAIFDPQQASPNDAHSILMRLIPPSANVLELGSASGYLSGYMEQSLGCRVTGLEGDPNAVEIAQTRTTAAHCVDLDAQNALDAAQSNAPYDVLLAAAILEHLKYPHRLLRSARELLTPNATIIVSLPNVANWRIRLMLLTGRFTYEDYGIMDRTHLHFYTLSTGKALLEDSGYPVHDIHISGSGIQNALSDLSRQFNRQPPPLILPSLFAYELIYVSHLSS